MDQPVTNTNKISARSSIKKTFMGGLFIASTLFAQAAFSAEHLQPIDAFKTIMVDGVDLPSAIGYPISQYSLAAVIDGEMEPIPFQIDEYNEGGAVYFESWDVPIAGSKDIFDLEDKLLFVYKDSGSRKKSHHRYDGKVLHEIELTSDQGHKRYVYLVQGSRLRSDEHYVRYSADEALVETDFYSITYNKDNHINWDDFSIVNYDGEENPFDALKIRLATGVLTNLTRTELNNKDLVATPVGEKVGPIRSTTQMEMTMWLMKLPILTMSLQLHHSPSSLVYDLRSVLPATRRAMLSEPELHISLEGNNLYGTEVLTAAGPKEAAITDGATGAIEQAHRDTGISIENNWIFASTKRNLDFVAFFDYLGTQTETISLHYNDERSIVDLPERFPGQLPKVGYKIHTLPADGFFGFAVNIFLSNGFKGNPHLFTDKLRRLPDLSISSL